MRYLDALLSEGQIQWFWLSLEMLCIQNYKCRPSCVAVGWDTPLRALLLFSVVATQGWPQPEAECTLQWCVSILLGPLTHASVFEPAGWWSVKHRMYWALLVASLSLGSQLFIRDGALVFSRTLFPLSSYSQVLVSWLGHWLCLVFPNAMLCTGFCQLVWKS